MTIERLPCHQIATNRNPFSNESHVNSSLNERKPYVKWLKLRKKHYFCKNIICNEVFSIHNRPAEAEIK